MNYENFFDDPVDRSGTFPAKWDETDKGGVPGFTPKKDVIPLWVADMDFSGPPEVSEALKKRAAHPIYGYTCVSPTYFETLSAWYSLRYKTELSPGDFLLGRGTIPGLSSVVKAFSRPGDFVLIFTPVYGPFFDVIRRNGREVLEIPLKQDSMGRYCFDIAEAEKAVAQHGSKNVPLALFCSPHNPGGSVWEKAELESFLVFAREHGIVVCADEIHGDIIHEPNRFISLASFDEYRTIVVSSANKTFNLGGLHASHFAVKDQALKETLAETIAREGGAHPDIFSMIATETAYSSGAQWLAALKKYLKVNIEEAVAALNAVRGVKAFMPQGTYLVWAYVSELAVLKNMKDEIEFVNRLEIEGRVKITPGSFFGDRGKGFVRINTASPRASLKEALSRIAFWAESKK